MEVENYIKLGKVIRSKLNMQCQYGSRYLNKGFKDYPYLGENIRIKGDISDYHSVLIHKDDVETFVQRVKDYKNTNDIY